jgi:hypothetical protein
MILLTSQVVPLLQQLTNGPPEVLESRFLVDPSGLGQWSGISFLTKQEGSQATIDHYSLSQSPSTTEGRLWIL